MNFFYRYGVYTRLKDWCENEANINFFKVVSSFVMQEQLTLNMIQVILFQECLSTIIP